MRTATLLLMLAAFGMAEESPSDNLKNASAAGRYSPEHDSYQYTEREREYESKPSLPPPLVDQFICDLDATILVVASTNKEKKQESYGESEQSSYGGNEGAPYAARTSYNGGGQQYGGQSSYQRQQPPSYGAPPPSSSYAREPERPPAAPNAVRLKCSHIATQSEDDCQSCCQLSARRDQSVSRRQIFGFLINGDEIDTGDDEPTRRKRQVSLAAVPHAPPKEYQPMPSSGFGATSPGYPAPTPGYAAAPAPVPAASPRSESNDDYERPSGGYSSGGSSSGVYSRQAHHSSYEYYGMPKNRRCVCCAPKRYEASPSKQLPAPAPRYRQRQYEEASY